MSLWYLERARWNRLWESLGIVLWEFKHGHQYSRALIFRDRYRKMQSDELIARFNYTTKYRNFPWVERDRYEMTVVFNRQLSITDGQNVYWLNRSAKRWICIEGPNTELPKHPNGDHNFKDPEKYKNLPVDEHGYYILDQINEL